MSFAVGWDRNATGDIDATWSDASFEQQERILTALTTIEAALRADPMNVGESRESDEERVVTCSPVTVHYRVDEEAQFVRVYAARVYW